MKSRIYVPVIQQTPHWHLQMSAHRPQRRRAVWVTYVACMILMVSLAFCLATPRTVFATESSADAAELGLSATNDDITAVVMWRLYNPNSGEHFYTSSLGEAKVVAKAGWNWEGVGWVAPSQGNPVYRLYNPNVGDHHYTLSVAERDMLVGVGWRYEGIGWYSDINNTTPIYRQYNPNARAGAHNFSANAHERDMLVSLGWRDEGVGWYALAPTSATEVGGFWIEGPAGRRAWIRPAGQVQTGYFELDGSSYYAPKKNGWVVQGRYDDGAGHVYLANAAGHLATRTGWLVTSEYGDGLQRYWMERLESGACAARTGHFQVEGNSYWGIAHKGYVLRNAEISLSGKTYTANNDGVLTEKKIYAPGEMGIRAQAYSSPTNYLILVSLSSHITNVYQGSQGNWNQIQSWLCTVGRPTTPTIRGVFSVGNRGYAFGTSAYTCYYWVQFRGDYLFHTIKYKAGTWEVYDGRLGVDASDGCVRLAPENAKWIYQHIPRETTVVVY